MKTLSLLALIFALTASSVNGYAVTSGIHVDSIAAKIQSTVTLPESCRSNENQRVFVVFSIAENGIVTVHEVGTADAELKTSIINQFQAMQFDNSDHSYDGMYSIWLNFKTL